jgi:hypothetical protein
MVPQLLAHLTNPWSYKDVVACACAGRLWVVFHTYCYKSSRGKAKITPTTMDASLISSHEYNILPQVKEAHESSEKEGYGPARAQLLELISDHNLNHLFSVHLLHKHLDAPDGKVMVYELVRSSDHPTFRVLVPRSPREDEDGEALLKPKYFFATRAGTMKAYEYSREPMPNTEKYHWFFPMFARRLLDLKVEDTFCLGIIPSEQLTGATEIELPEFHATVFVRDLELPDPCAITEWMTEAQAVDTEGILINQARNAAGRCLYHKMGHGAAGFEFIDGGEQKLCVNGVPLGKDTSAYSIITNALDYIAVA